MILTGIADEAGKDLATQIRAHQELGWSAIELRLVDGQNVAGEMDDAAFSRLVTPLRDAGMTVTCFASAIGNWSRTITDDFEIDRRELLTAAKRMKRLGVTFIRTMSWVQGDAGEAHWRDETIRRYRELVKIAAEQGVVLAHENCTGWAGLSAENTRRLVDEVNSEHLAVLFDTGNTISHGHEPWDFFQGVKDLIGYVHVKDCRWSPDRGRSQDYAFLGDGHAMVRQILTDLIVGGYDGVISIEPHIAAVVHQGPGDADPQKMFDSYIHYGRRLQEMVGGIVSTDDGE